MSIIILQKSVNIPNNKQDRWCSSSIYFHIKLLVSQSSHLFANDFYPYIVMTCDLKYKLDNVVVI